MGLEITTPSNGGINLTDKQVTIGGEVRVKNSDSSFDQTYTPDNSPITLPDSSITLNSTVVDNSIPSAKPTAKEIAVVDSADNPVSITVINSSKVRVPDPGDYGTRILSVLRREHCVTSAMGFALGRYLDDEAETTGKESVKIVRVADSEIKDFTPPQLIAGEHVTWINAGGGVQHGYVIGNFDHTLSGFYLYNTNTAYMPYIVKSGVGVVDPNGNPAMELRSTQGFLIGSEAHNTGYPPLWNTDSTLWVVQRLKSGASQAWQLSVSGNPAVARVGSGAFPNSIHVGSPTTKVNNTTLADQNWDTLKAATEDVMALVTTINIDFTQRTQWSQNAAVKLGLSYPVGSLISEMVITHRSAAAHENLIYNDADAYYNFP